MGDYMKMEDFLRFVEKGYLIDDDGLGYLCSSENTRTDPKILIYPSDVDYKFYKEYLYTFPGVMWYNR